MVIIWGFVSSYVSATSCLWKYPENVTNKIWKEKNICFKNTHFKVILWLWRVRNFSCRISEWCICKRWCVSLFSQGKHQIEIALLGKSANGWKEYSLVYCLSTWHWQSTYFSFKLEIKPLHSSVLQEAINILLKRFFVEMFFDLLHNSTLKSYFETHYLSVKTWQTGTCKKKNHI